MNFDQVLIHLLANLRKVTRQAFAGLMLFFSFFEPTLPYSTFVISRGVKLEPIIY